MSLLVVGCRDRGQRIAGGGWVGDAVSDRERLMGHRATTPSAFEMLPPKVEAPATVAPAEPEIVQAPATIELPPVRPVQPGLNAKVEALLEEAKAMLDAGRAKAAMVPLKRAALEAPRAPKVLLALAQGHARIGDDGPAVRTFDTLLEVQPDMVDALYGKAVALARLGKLEAARPLVEKLKRMRPQDATVRRLAARVADPSQVLAESLRAARTGNAQAALEHADRLARAGRVAESANFYKAAAAKAPKDATLHMKWGTALAAGGRLAEARDALRTAIQADPKRVAAWQTLAAVQIRMRDHVGAADTLSGMLKAVPRLARSGEVQARIDRLRAQRTP